MKSIFVASLMMAVSSVYAGAETKEQEPLPSNSAAVQQMKRGLMTPEERAKRRAEFKARMEASRQAREAERAAAKAAGTNRLAKVQRPIPTGVRKELDALRAEVKALRADVEALKAAKK